MSLAAPSRVATPPLLTSCPHEAINTITHLVGLILALAAAPVLLAKAAEHGPWQVAIASVYLVTMCGTYLASTLSHAFAQPDLQRLFRMADQGMIFLFIAGTCTPVLLGCLPLWVSGPLMTAVWAVALAGFVGKVALGHRIYGISVTLYLVLGWLPILALPAILYYMPLGCTALVIGGGVIYTIGTYFLMSDRREYYYHAIWHVLVLTAGAVHFAAIYYYAV